MHTKATISGNVLGNERYRKEVEGGKDGEEIRLDASDTKKSMISFRTRRDLLILFCSSLSFCAICSYPVSLITGCAIIPVYV